MDINSLPQLNQEQLQAMSAIAEQEGAQEQPNVNQNDQIETPKVETTLQMVKQQQETEQAKNFKVLREEREKAIRERDEMIRYVRELESQKSANPPEDLDFSIAPDELAEGKHLTKVQKKMQALEQQNLQAQARLKEFEVMMTLKTECKDYDSVMTNDNINKLQTDHPEIAALIMQAKDPYAARKSAYKFIKSLGIVEDSSMDKQKAEENNSKPRSLASVGAQQGGTPLSKANAFDNALTDELKSQLFKEMNLARRGY